MIADHPQACPEQPSTLDTVHDSLRERILSGELTSGTPISQARIAREYGVSRSPVREACRLLEREGLVESRARRRVRVAEFSVSDLEEIYASRLVLECLALRQRLPRLTSVEHDQMTSAFAEMRAAAERHDYEQFTGPHDRFHSFLTTEVGPRFDRLVEALNEHARRYRRVYTTGVPMAWDLVLDRDEALLAAARSGDVTSATDELALHLAATALSTIALVSPSHEPTLLRAALDQVRR